MDYYHLLKKQLLNFEVIIPFHQFNSELDRELAAKNIKPLIKNNKIYIIEPTEQNIIWAQDHWKNCFSSEYNSELYAKLKGLPNIGYYHKTELNKNIERSLSQLKRIPEKRILFNTDKPFNFKFYIWTIFNDIVIYSLEPKSKYPAGWHEFAENKDFPPNRAYLKLWEVFTTQDLKIDKSASAIEIGASPGGWSWVLSQKFKNVYTFDRAPLADQIAKIPNVKHELGDAFKIDPSKYNDCSWFFSDLICAPEKLYETVLYWLDHSPIQNYVCTLKFKGECNFEVIDNFLKIPDSKIVRLYHNKHEVTWIRQRNKN